MKRRSLLRTLELPKGANPRALAESLRDDFNVATITGSNGEYEVEMLSPDELVVVINASRARFFIEPRDDEDEDDEDDEDFDDEEEDDPHDVAEDMSFYLSKRLGLVRDEGDDPDENAGTPDDDSDELARRIVARLLDEGLLELVTPRSRPTVESHLAHCLAQGKNAEKLCDELAEVKGVAELYTSNEQFAEILASCRKKRAPAPGREPVRSVLEKLFSRPPDSPSRPVSRPPMAVENVKPKPALEKHGIDKPTKLKPTLSKSVEGKSVEGKSVEPKVSTTKTATPKASKTIKKLKSKK
jgi:hypothetical protein